MRQKSICGRTENKRSGKTKRAGYGAATSIQDFVEKKMKLKVNKEKSKVDKPVNRKFLGFSFYYMKGK